jgi:hypothetical protein
MRPTLSQSMRASRQMFGLVHGGGQVPHQVLEVFGELGAHPGKGDALGPHPVGGTDKAPQVGPELQAPHTQIQMAPAGSHGPGVVAVAGGVVALGAHQPPPSQDDGDGHRLGVEGYVDDVDAGQGQKALKCSGDAHGRAPFGFAVLTATNLPGLRARQLPIAGVPGVPARPLTAERPRPHTPSSLPPGQPGGLLRRQRAWGRARRQGPIGGCAGGLRAWSRLGCWAGVPSTSRPRSRGLPSSPCRSDGQRTRWHKAEVVIFPSGSSTFMPGAPKKCRNDAEILPAARRGVTETPCLTPIESNFSEFRSGTVQAI